MSYPSTDDLCPEHMDFFKKHIDPLARKYPNFRIIAFTVPRWHDKKKNDLMKNKKFIEFCRDRKSFLRLAMHGFDHLSYESKDNLLTFKKSRKYFEFLREEGLSMVDGYKPPFYAWDSSSLFNAKKVGFKFFFTQDGLIDLETRGFVHRKEIGLIDSHVNPNQKVNKRDRIDLKPFKFLEDIHELIK